MAKSDSTRTRAKKQPRKKSRVVHKSEWARIAAQARKKHQQNAKRELAAKWRALKKLGYIKTTVVPSQKRLTKFRITKINKAFREANKQATLQHGRVIRALQKQVTENGRIKYNLDKHFKLIRSKYNPSDKAGFHKTLKGFVVQLLSPDEKVRISKKGKVTRTQHGKNKIRVEQEFMSGTEILKLADKITKGKFHIKENQVLLVNQFGGFESGTKPYHPEALDLFVVDMNKYRATMQEKTFQAWLDMTEIRVVTIG